MENKRKRLQERLSTMGASYYAKGASVSSPSTTEKTLTGLHNFSSTGWGMQQSPRESHLEIIDGILNSDSLLSNGKHPQMRKVSRICGCFPFDNNESEFRIPSIISKWDSLGDCCIPHPVEEKLCKPVKVFSVVDGDDTLAPLA